MCAAVGDPVVRLRRVRIGPIQDRALPPGRFRDLTRGEIVALRQAVTPAGSRSTPQAERSADGHGRM